MSLRHRKILPPFTDLLLYVRPPHRALGLLFYSSKFDILTFILQVSEKLKHVTKAALANGYRS